MFPETFEKSRTARNILKDDGFTSRSGGKTGLAVGNIMIRLKPEAVFRGPDNIKSMPVFPDGKIIRIA